MGALDDPRRRQILSDRKVHESIRTIARRRGMPEQEVDDILDTVIADAMEDGSLPLDDREEAKRYLDACARNKSIDEGRKRARRSMREVPVDESTMAAEELPSDERVRAARLVEEGEKRFPRAFGWFLRNLFGGETHVQIALEANVSPAHVRKEVSRVRHALQGLGTLVAACIVVLFALHHRRAPGGLPVDHDDLATTASTAPMTPPPPSSAVPKTPVEEGRALRLEARQLCDEGEWELCRYEIARARDLDPDGHTPEDQKLSDQATKKLGEQFAKPRPPR
jgi:DNA-directed RNA polymerase specialized sigma24 family protein